MTTRWKDKSTKQLEDKTTKIQNTKYKMQNAKYKIQNTKYKIQNTKYKIHSKSNVSFSDLFPACLQEQQTGLYHFNPSASHVSFSLISTGTLNFMKKQTYRFFFYQN